MHARHRLAAAALGLAAGALLANSHALAAPGAPGCSARDALGVERVIEIDTRGGPLYGNMQYKDIDPLKDGEVVLTFDDGPLRPYTRPVLKALAEHCTKATFFMVGRMAVADPEMVREVATQGHTVGLHTWSHKDLRRRNAASAAGEIELGLSAVSEALGKRASPFFRFPYLSDPTAMIGYLKDRDIAMFSIDIDSHDYKTRSAARVHQTIMSQLLKRRKGILLFHDIQPSTAGALKGLLDELKARGFKIVHMVAKEPARTDPTYDAQAAEILAKRRTHVAAQPLTSRTITWARDEPSDRGHQLRTGSSGAAQVRPPAVQRPAQPKADDDAWRWRVLGIQPN